MFEKESQDYAMREVAPRQELYIKGRADIDADYEKVKKIWQDGAEFGYNKANEWHYVKDGDLPKDEKLCLIWCGEKDFNTAEYVRERFWDLCGGWLEVDEVIAWKEIVLPKESE